MMSLTCFAIRVLTVMCILCTWGCQMDLEEKAIVLMTKLADTATAHAGNCDKMGQALDDVLTRNQAIVTDLKTLRQGKTESETRELETRFGPKRLDAAKKMSNAALPCADNQAVIRALINM